MSAKATRQQLIRELLARNHVSSQEQLQALLRAESVETTQATLSRDLREMGISKRENGYALPEPRSRPRTERRQLERAVRDGVVSADRAGNLVVLRTRPGLGPALLPRIEQADLPQVLGVVGGGDTLFVATPSWNQAAELARLFRRLARI